MLVRSTAEEAAGDPELLPGSWEERLALALARQSSAKETEACSIAFPLGLQLRQVFCWHFLCHPPPYLTLELP